MAPEQAKGRAADKRSDIWAFGCVLYEMLTGRRAFDGEDMTEVLGAVVRVEPKWEALPADVPPAVRTLLQQCIVKDRRKRVADIAAALFVLDHQAGIAAGAETSAKSNPVPWLIAGLTTVGAIAMGIVAARGVGDVPPPPGPMQFTIAAPENTAFGGPVSGGTGSAAQIAVSPDGRNIVFVAGEPSAYQIWLRPVATASAQPIQGTEGGTFPFWSPDGRFVAFFADGKLKKVAIAGGPPIVLCDAPTGRGGSWSRDDVILWGSAVGVGVMRVSGAGGVPVTVTRPGDGEDAHRWPYFLPDGQHFLYTAVTGTCCPPVKPGTVRVASLDQSASAVSLFQADSSTSYASGHLLFARDQTLMAQPFDADTRQLTGDAFPLAERISREGSRYTSASASENGTLVYVQGGSPSPLQLTWFDRTGRTLGTLGEGATDANPALSPDERQVAIALRSDSSGNLDIWTIDVARNLRSRVTFGPEPQGWPVWSPDGKRIVFGNGAQGPGGQPEKALLQQTVISGAATSDTLLEAAGTPPRPCGARQCTVIPTDWSPDGRFVLYTLAGGFPVTSDIWALPLSGDRTPFPVAESRFSEGLGVFSPDGRWIAFTTDETGQTEVYVQPFLREGGKYRISPNGGRTPRWRADGKELFYVEADGTMMAVAIDGRGQLEAGVPQTLFDAAVGGVGGTNMDQSYVVTKDGQRFLVNRRSLSSTSAAPLTVVVNWPATLQK
jgi:Tol biopolymer transport system component